MPIGNGEPMKDADAGEVQGLIFDAFQGIPYPGDDRIASHPCPECQDIMRRFRGKDWKQFTERPMELIGEERDCLPLLDPEAFRFFLPAFLLATVREYDEADIISDSLLSEFLDTEPAQRGRIETLTPDQRQAVWKTFEFLQRRHPDDFEESELESIRQNLGIRER